MSDQNRNLDLKEKIQELQELIVNAREVRYWKRLEAVRLRLLGFSYQEIKHILLVSISFIAKIQKKYIEKGIQGLQLQYKGSKSYLTSSEKAEIQEWLKLPERRNISELERHLIETYDVVFKSPESYYKILKKQLSWQKANRENPRKDPDKVEEKNKEIAALLNQYKAEIEAKTLVVYAMDECHLQGDDICNYLWGDRKDREIIKIENERDRQTYYGALNLCDRNFLVKAYSSGNGENTVKFLKELKALHPDQKILLFWDGASYHRGDEMKQFLADVNQEKDPEDWLIICHLFAPYAPDENPVEAIWLQVKNFIRRFYYICKNFSIVKRLFQFFFDFQLFNFPDLKKYQAFVQLI